MYLIMLRLRPRSVGPPQRELRTPFKLKSTLYRSLLLVLKTNLSVENCLESLSHLKIFVVKTRVFLIKISPDT